MNQNESIKQLTLRLPENVHREFKASTAREGRSMGEVAMKLIMEYLKDK